MPVAHRNFLDKTLTVAMKPNQKLSIIVFMLNANLRFLHKNVTKMLNIFAIK